MVVGVSRGRMLGLIGLDDNEECISLVGTIEYNDNFELT